MKLRDSGQLTFIDGLRHVLDSCLRSTCGIGEEQEEDVVREKSLLALDRVEEEDLAAFYAAIQRAVSDNAWIIIDNLSALLYIGLRER